jgi:hypothetical protein
MTEYTQLERQTDDEYICSSIIRTDNAHAHNSKLSSQYEYDWIVHEKETRQCEDDEQTSLIFNWH